MKLEFGASNHVYWILSNCKKCMRQGLCVLSSRWRKPLHKDLITREYFFDYANEMSHRDLLSNQSDDDVYRMSAYSCQSQKRSVNKDKRKNCGVPDRLCSTSVDKSFYKQGGPSSSEDKKSLLDNAEWSSEDELHMVTPI